MRIEIKHMDAGYGDKKILHDINLVLDGPGLYCIIGPNGVGKSTLIKCFNRLLTPQSGEVLLDGRNVSEMTRKEIAEKIAYVPVQSEDLFSMPVFDTVLIGRSNKSEWKTSREDIVKVKKILEALNISQFSDRPFNELSAGQHQTVAIARGIVQETPVLILDEPTSNLDVRHQIFITSMLQKIAAQSGVMVIMISHNLNIAAMFADRIVLMAPPGTVKQVGTASEVITEENMSDVYNVGCKIIDYEGRPVMVLDHEIYRSKTRPGGPPRAIPSLERHTPIATPQPR